MSRCQRVYPTGPQLNFMPLMQRTALTPDWYNPQLQATYNWMQSGYALNVDGKPLKMNPCAYTCSMNHMDQVQPVYWDTHAPYTVMGGIKTVPKFFYNCSRRPTGSTLAV